MDRYSIDLLQNIINKKEKLKEIVVLGKNSGGHQEDIKEKLGFFFKSSRESFQTKC